MISGSFKNNVFPRETVCKCFMMAGQRLFSRHSGLNYILHKRSSIEYKSKIAGIKGFNGHERGTSSHCPTVWQ